MYTVDYFINKFQSIPEEKWTSFTQMDENGNRCALGWCDPREYQGERFFPNGTITEEGLALTDLFFGSGIYFCDYSKADHGVARVNNGVHPKYKQDTPKQRILAALYDIKESKESKETQKSVNFVQELINKEVTELVN